jgi:hypothetical protein
VDFVQQGDAKLLGLETQVLFSKLSTPLIRANILGLRRCAARAEDKTMTIDALFPVNEVLSK